MLFDNEETIAACLTAALEDPDPNAFFAAVKSVDSSWYDTVRKGFRFGAGKPLQSAPQNKRTFMGPLNLIKDKRDDILRLSKLHGARNVRIFGSVARDDAGPNSDVDFLVDLAQGRSLLDLGGLLVDLERLLGRKVDIVTERGLHWYLRDKILKEARPL